MPKLKAKEKRFPGKCSFCNEIVGKAEIRNHLASCPKREPLLIESLSNGRKDDKYFHLIVEGRYKPEYWLHILISAKTKLRALDSFLRQIWLECCGHLSAFAIDDQIYSEGLLEDGEAKSMNIMLKSVILPGKKFFYKYDFGSTTELSLEIIEEITSNNMQAGPQILARNEEPLTVCGQCGDHATVLCVECSRNNGCGLLCDKCVKEHECLEEAFMPIVNSPRVGVCGYTGNVYH